MTRRNLRIPRGIVSAALALALMVTASFAALAATDPSLAPIGAQCVDQFHPVLCDRNHDPGGVIGCFNSICEALAVGAYHCQPLTSSCEPVVAAGGASFTLREPPALEMSAKNCEQFPFPVNCHANTNQTGPSYYACFDTMCDAVAAGAYQCVRQFKGTCEPQ